jgi:hypothetical protein
MTLILSAIVVVTVGLVIELAFVADRVEPKGDESPFGGE